MHPVPGNPRLQRIVVLNPKGGCGKTTLSTNLASYFAQRGSMPSLFDTDPGGYAMRWLERRPENLPAINGNAIHSIDPRTIRSWQHRVADGCQQLIVDTPASLDNQTMHNLIYDADSILIPIMPSAIDIRFAARFIAELLLVAQIDRDENRIAIVANRTRRNTRSMQQLMRFLKSLRIPIISVLKDSQNYVIAADQGLGVCDLPRHRAREDQYDIARVAAWLDRWRESQDDFIPAAHYPAIDLVSEARLQ